MTDTESVTMTDDECEALLGRTATGVLSLTTAADEPPHTLPVSFGYDSVTSSFYFRLADADSQKGELAGRPASFVTYDHDGTYSSVVASGTLESTTDDETATEALAGFERVTIPYVDIHGEPPAEVEFTFYRLVPDELTGRKEATTEL
ncbi:hypothetical protein SAMN05216226_10196 [Halovenus aranensis]|jgi:nitroimidazol reductase NimA-like FMN-containing flavoprotein (pyridoxamine 5'-phosphate oxidase superfamily)|uniref:Pyridoxamine 5'-phosphate oxidase n=1 Tax=Halovenus aranensis TaxID=890420 RepID=A0A1G8RSI2_9EURY|nr:pyridoxamine 5'-phosphate oxidase family protein [Halovenus aranensis]SDJ19937.1 hypothetical protein SAMN05216226_10196 [Halovenus aranensis]